jgi:hypothetical protein
MSDRHTNYRFKNNTDFAQRFCPVALTLFLLASLAGCAGAHPSRTWHALAYRTLRALGPRAR